MSLRLSDGTGITKHFERNSEESLESIMSKIVKDSRDEKWLELDIKRPLPRRIIKKSSSEMKKYLKYYIIANITYNHKLNFPPYFIDRSNFQYLGPW